MDIGMVAVLDFLTTQAVIARINGHAAFFNGFEAVQGFRKSACQIFELGELVAIEEVGMCQAPALKRTLEQLHALFLGGKVFERHWR